jgi:hypothetical protein
MTSIRAFLWYWLELCVDQLVDPLLEAARKSVCMKFDVEFSLHPKEPNLFLHASSIPVRVPRFAAASSRLAFMHADIETMLIIDLLTQNQRIWPRAPSKVP